MIRFAFLIVTLLSLGGYAINLTEEKKEPGEVAAAPVDSAVNKPLIDQSLLHIQFCGDTVPLRQLHIARRYQRAVKLYDYPAFRKNEKKFAKDLRVISAILKKEGIPSDFKYIPIVESAFDAEPVSRRGAAGYWQFMPETARALGLVVDDENDERKDLIKSTHAAAKYLKWLYRDLGNWTLVAAAYNIGPTRLIRHMDAQNKNNYFHLRLNSETAKYVYKLVAVKEWFNRPDRCSEWVDESFVTRLDESNKMAEFQAGLKNIGIMNASR